MRRRHCHAQVSAEEGEPPYYLIEYTVESSRGRKVYVCKYCIFNKRLYVLQAQAKQDTFDAKDEDGASVREALPPAQRPLYDTVLRAACAGLDWGDQPPERGMVGLPARRIWPCWGLRRCRREGNPVE